MALPRKDCCLFILIVISLSFGKTEAIQRSRETQQKLKKLLPAIVPLFTTPDISQCIHSKHYLINHILYVCFHYGTGGPIKVMTPIACTTSNDLTYRRVGFGKTYKDSQFAYQCVQEKHVYTYKPISCMYHNIEITPGQSLRISNIQLECVRHPQGDMAIVQRRYMHNLCNLGGSNETLARNDRCPGLTKTVIHSNYGMGSAVRYNGSQNILLPVDLPKVSYLKKKN